MHAVCIVYDDLSKQAVPPTDRCRCCCGVRRGARRIPADVFYLHSRLLERAAKLQRGKRGSRVV